MKYSAIAQKNSYIENTPSQSLNKCKTIQKGIDNAKVHKPRCHH